MNMSKCTELPFKETAPQVAWGQPKLPCLRVKVCVRARNGHVREHVHII